VKGYQPEVRETGAVRLCPPVNRSLRGPREMAVGDFNNDGAVDGTGPPSMVDRPVLLKNVFSAGESLARRAPGRQEIEPGRHRRKKSPGKQGI